MEIQQDVSTLQEVVLQKIQEKELSRPQLIQAIGYKNISKGLRKLDIYLSSLQAPDDAFVKNLLRVLEIDGLTFYRSIKATLASMDRAAEKEFKPYLVLEINFQPRPWFAAQAIYHQRTVQVPFDLQQLPFEEEVASVKALYEERVKNLSYESRVIGFEYYRRHNYCLVFDDAFVLTDAFFIQAGGNGKKYLGNRVVDLLLNM
jgi:hypothetical protein